MRESAGGFGAALLLGSVVLASPSAGTVENVLILVADDLGVDHLAAYGIGADLPTTPNLDALAAGGMRFDNAWANPVCSPSRAMLVTGRYAFRTGIGVGVKEHGWGLPLEEVTLPELLDLGTGGAWQHAAFGKWHLGSEAVGGLSAANLAGWDHFDGTQQNLVAPYDYYEWPQVTNGELAVVTGYATTHTVDSFLAWRETAVEPWLAYVSFHAPHAPWQAPPPELHTVDLAAAGPPGTDPRPYYKAMVEAMDTEIGRLLAGLGPALDTTNVLFLGDNGSPEQVLLPEDPPGKHKSSVFQGGVHVPLLVSGPRVAFPGTTSDALVALPDVFATVAELAGVDPLSVLPVGTPFDGVSFLAHLADPDLPSTRTRLYAEVFEPNGLGTPSDFLRTVSDGRFKYHVYQDGTHHLFDLAADYAEEHDLLAGVLDPEAQAALLSLADTLYPLLALDAPAVLPLGCGVNPPESLMLVSGLPVLGGTIVVGLDNPLGTQPAGCLPLAGLFRFSQPCGTLFEGLGMTAPGEAAGELLVQLSSLLGTVGGLPWAGPGQPALVPLLLPGSAALVGTPLYVQGLLSDPAGPNALTAALELRLSL